VVNFDCCINSIVTYSLVRCVCYRMPHQRKPTGRDRDPRVFPFALSCQLCGAQEHSYGNFTQHMLERGCLGHPVHCGHCGAIFSSGFDLLQHLNVGGWHGLYHFQLILQFPYLVLFLQIVFSPLRSASAQVLSSQFTLRIQHLQFYSSL